MLSNSLTALNRADLTSQDFSTTQNILKAGEKWNKAGGIRTAAAHTIIPILVIGTSALDVLAHVLNAAAKGTIILASTVSYYATFAKVNFKPNATTRHVVSHAGRALGYLTMVVLQPLIAAVNCKLALSILQKSNLVKIKNKTKWEAIKEVAGAAHGKVQTLARSLLAKASEHPKAVGGACIGLLALALTQGYFRKKSSNRIQLDKAWLEKTWLEETGREETDRVIRYNRCIKDCRYPDPTSHSKGEECHAHCRPKYLSEGGCGTVFDTLPRYLGYVIPPSA